MARAKYLKNAFALCLLIATVGPGLWAQFTSSIEGTITDVTGATGPDVDLVLSQGDTGVTHNSRTNSAGYYVFPTFPPGRYSLTATKPGFETVRQSGIIIETQRVQNVSLTPKVGAVTQEITVTGAATPIERTNPKVSTLVSNEYFQNVVLPSKTGHATSL